MDRALVEKLKEKLVLHCPVDTGALRASISGVQGNEKEWVITIGNDDASINGTPTIQYARITNFARTLTIRGQQYTNPNYRWVENAVFEWVQENRLLIDLEVEEDETEEDTE